MSISKLLIIVLFICISTISRLYTQVSLLLNISLDEFSLSGTSPWSISITNSASKTYNCYLHVTITVPNEGIIADGTSKSFSLKPFETRINQQTVAELADSSKIDYDKSYRESYLRNNELPSKKYTVCLELIETGTGIMLATSCQDLEPQKFRAPVNIYPFDRDTIIGGNLSFQWLPPQPYNPEFEYSIRVVEVLSIQTSISAFYSNNYYYTEDYLKVPVLPYPIHARPLEEGKTYAWLIESRMGGLELKSEPTTFVVRAPEVIVPKKVNKTPTQYSQYIDLLSGSAREIQIISSIEIPIMLENRGAPYQLIYCITGNERNVLAKGKIPVSNGFNKILIPTGDLKESKDEVFHLNLFSSNSHLPGIRFKQLKHSTVKP